jgi:ABC-2 type transport system permease protein
VSRGGFAGTGRLIRLGLRRDRITLPLWILTIAGIVWASVASLTALYSTEAERVAAATFTAATPVTRIFDGPAAGTSLGAITMVELYGFLAIVVALLSITTVTRHTRQNEETGRAELIGSAVVGHRALLTAGLVVALGANVMIGAAVALTLLAGDLPLGGSLLAGALVVGVGAVFSGVAAVTAQVAGTQRGANGLAAVVLGIAFFLRAVGDVIGEVAPSGVELLSAWPSWLSPIGWGQQARAFSTDQWWVLGLFAVTAVALVGAAFVLIEHRDQGAGMLADRPGPARASARLRTPLALALRLQWRLLVGWGAALLALATAFGAIGDQADELIGISDEFAAMFEAMAGGTGGLLDAYVAVMMGMLAMVAAGALVQALLRARTEEANGHLEPVLATGVGRTRWLLATVACAVAGVVVLIVLTGVTAAAAYGVATEQWADGFSTFLPAALVQIPAVLALGGFVVAAFALLPRWATALSWAALAGSLVIGQFGGLLELPQAVMDVSPFAHVPPVPLEALRVAPLAGLVVVAVALAVVGLTGFRRRDVLT